MQRDYRLVHKVHFYAFFNDMFGRAVNGHTRLEIFLVVRSVSIPEKELFLEEILLLFAIHVKSTYMY